MNILGYTISVQYLHHKRFVSGGSGTEQVAQDLEYMRPPTIWAEAIVSSFGAEMIARPFRMLMCCLVIVEARL
jgi:hypothetical protein